tara:strand:- start:42 stop:530 length:489 start_codon:yes stop_codon:yes gene_type:complete
MEPVDYSDRQYFLSDKSMQRLDGVHPDLVKCVEKVSAMCVDLNVQVLEGKRTELEHTLYYEKGVTQKSDHSAHLYGFAVDLGIFIGDRLCLEAEPYDDVTQAMIFAAQEVGIKLRWGGAPQIDDMRESDGFVEDLTNDWIDYRRERQKRPIVDFHHFEIGLD